jgi:hypothetical protein
MRLKNFSTALGLATAAIVSALSVGGCVEDRTTLFIAGVTGFEDDKCDTEVSLAGQQLASGTYDPSTGNPYVVWLLIANGIQPLGDNDTLRSETSRIVVEGAVVRVEESGGGEVAAYTVDSSVLVHPSESSEPGLTSAPIPVIPGGLGLDNGLYVLYISVFGETHGGIDVESSEYAFAVDVRSGALRCSDGAGHPCGPALAQDGYAVACGDVTPECPACPDEN